MTNRYNSFKFFVAELFSKIKENGDIANESFYTLTIKNLILSRDDWCNADNAAKDRLFEHLSMDVPNNLAICYKNGDGVTQNMGEAVKLFSSADTVISVKNILKDDFDDLAYIFKDFDS